MKCKVLLPRKLYHPVIRYKSNSKLMLPLCSACAASMNQGNCTHTDEETCTVGTWVVDEDRKAIEMGYIIVNVFEFWECEITCFDRGNNSGGLFAAYVNMFLKLRHESSGYPSWVQSEVDKDTYIEDYGRRRNSFIQGINFQKMRG